MNKRGVAFNGKFLAAPATGVQRVAEELIKHVDILLDNEQLPASSWTLFTPQNANRDLSLRNIHTKRSHKLTGQRWEQFELPRFSAGTLLINLCNQAPLFRRGGIVMIHDAQAFVSPKSYSWPFRIWYRFSCPHIGARAAMVLTVSNYSRDQLVENGVAPAHKIQVIYNGIDHLASIKADNKVLSKFGLTPGSYVVSLSNTQKHKNIAILFAAFSRLSSTSLKLVLVGEPGRQAFERQGEIPPTNVIFSGKISDAALRALYENAICLAFPSTTEGFGLPPLEAMMAGCPAVVAPCGALPEVCGDAAIFVAPHDADGWARAITELAADSVMRRNWVDKGRARAGEFKWEDSAKKLLRAILETL